MPHDLLIALMAFAFASSVTPGPNNLMLLASGANHGFRRTLPHMLGISLGHAFMVMMVGLGLGKVFDLYPFARLMLQTVSTAYLIYLAWKIATAAPPEAGQAKGRPLTFLQAAAFQWVNPKAWYMAIYAISNYVPGDMSVPTGAVTVAAIFAITNFPAITLWATLGTQIRRLLFRPRLLRSFNAAMALLLILTLWPVWVG